MGLILKASHNETQADFRITKEPGSEEPGSFFVLTAIPLEKPQKRFPDFVSSFKHCKAANLMFYHHIKPVL